MPPPVSAIVTVPVTRGTIVETVEATGALQAVKTVQVGTQVSGTIKALQADFNTTVRRGQIIAELDPALFETQVEQARAALYQREVNLAHTVITAPIDGIVISRNVDVGQTVAASMQAPTLFVLARDLKAMQVNASIAESDIRRISAGQGVTFHVDRSMICRLESRDCCATVTVVTPPRKTTSWCGRSKRWPAC